MTVRRKHSASNAPVGIALAVLITSVFVGFSISILPWYLASLPVVAIGFAWLAWRLPEYAVLALCAIQTGLLPTQLVSHTLMILALVGITTLVAFKHLRESEAWWRILRPYAMPFATLLFLVGASGVRGLLFGGIDKGNIAEEAIQLLFWLAFPALAISLKSHQRLNAFLVVLLLLALYVAVGQFLQAIFHQQIFFAGRIEDAETLGQTFSGVTRSVTPAIFLLILGLLIAAGLVVSNVRPVPSLFLMGICTLGLAFTYGRTLVAGTLLALVVVGLLLGIRRAVRLALVGAIVGTLAMMALAFAKPAIYDALEDRLLSIRSELVRGDSFNYRLIENRAAIEKISGAPLLGIGIGKDYRQPYLIGLQGDAADVQARYMHNGYLYVLLKLGVTGLLAYVVFIGIFFARARRALKAATQSYDRVLIAAPTALVLIPVFTAVTRPEWMSGSSTAVFAICMALVTAVQRHINNEAASANGVPANTKPKYLSGTSFGRRRQQSAA